MKTIILSLFILFGLMFFSGCESIQKNMSYYDCSDLTPQEKQLMNEQIVRETQLMQKSFETIFNSSYHPDTISSGINKIINNIHTKAREEYCKLKPNFQ